MPPVPINLQDTHKKTITLAYDSSTKVLLETIKDDTTNLTFSHTYNSVDIPGNVGGSTAFVGFTGGTGAFAAYPHLDAQESTAHDIQCIGEPVNIVATGSEVRGRDGQLR